MNDTLPIDWEAAKTFLQLLGKNGDSRLRAIFHKSSPAEVKRQGARKPALNPDAIKAVQLTGRGIYVVINDGGDNRVSITHCRAYFAEFDGCDEAEQWQRVLQSGLPEPSIVNATGGGSLHFYWVLSSPVTDVAQWQADMKRLIAHLGSDKNVNDPSRVMRLPGCWYMDGNQQPVAQVQIVHQSDAQYTREQIIGCLPELKTPKTSPTPQPLSIYANAERTERRALEQLNRIPPRIPGSNTRDDYLSLFWGLVAITGPERAAQLMEEHSPEWAAQDDLLTLANDANGSITEATFFEIAKRKWGITSPTQPEPAAEPEGAAQADELLDDDDHDLKREALERFRLAQQSSIDLIEVFGPVWGQLLINRAAAFPCDPAVLLLPMLGYISSLVGTKVHVKVKQGWKEPMVVWGYIAQPPSSLKSPAGGVFGGPLAALQAQAIQNHAKEFNSFKTKEKRWKSECRRREDEAKKHDKPAELAEPPETPTPARHYYIETITLERVASIHAQPNVVGLLAFHDELSDWFASLEKKAAQTDRPRWLKLWTGQAIKHDTATSVNAFTDKTAISIVGFIQPDKLADLYQNESRQDTGSAGDGLWSRFLPVIPRTIPFKFNYLEVDLTEDLLNLATELDKTEPNTILSIPRHVIDNALEPAWERWAAMEGETSGARAAFIGKLRGYSVRFAGLLHLLNNDLGDIDITTAQTAINLCEFFLAQFDQISPQISSNEDVDTPTARFLQKVKDKEADCVRVRDLQRWKLLGKQASSKRCHDFLHSLAEQGIGSFQQVHSKGSAKGAWEWRP